MHHTCYDSKKERIKMGKVNFHITVKAIVIHEGKILIMKRVRPSSDGLGWWELPGGGLEYGEPPHEALIRELKEETGLDIKILKPVYTFTAIRENYQTVGIGFLTIPTNDHVILSDEHTDYRFVSQDELKDSLDVHIYKDIEKALDEYNQLIEYHKLKK
jgi:8-oxo-dGTP diphosphatase